MVGAGENILRQVDLQGLAAFGLGRQLVWVEGWWQVPGAGHEDRGLCRVPVLVPDGVEHDLRILGDRHDDVASPGDSGRFCHGDGQVVAGAVGVLVVLQDGDLHLTVAEDIGHGDPVVSGDRRQQRRVLVDQDGGIPGDGGAALVGDVVGELVAALFFRGDDPDVLADHLQVRLPGAEGTSRAVHDADGVAVGVDVVLGDGQVEALAGADLDLVRYRHGQLVAVRRGNHADPDLALPDVPEPVPDLIGEGIGSAGSARGLVGEVAALDLRPAESGAGGAAFDELD